METRAPIKTMETQMGQLTAKMGNRTQENSPSTSEAKEKEQFQAISLRSGKSYEEPSGKQLVEDGFQDQRAQTQTPKEKKTTEGLAPRKALPSVNIDHHIKIPYLQRLRKNNLNKQFSKFLEIFKKLHINIPFAEALEQMPTDLKFMK
ncbi:hypothetical protein CsatB_007304 [Cannabis sativa]|uniref:uncharacterized protein LOC115722067 n=1 Tax=Cannabis sativa TaxID=3483 RepID=UPI0011DF2945|nr:uncharacterized protein LOC115722067 [Cannabis sativa]